MSYDKRKQQQQPRSKKGREFDPRAQRAQRHQRREDLNRVRERELSDMFAFA